MKPYELKPCPFCGGKAEIYMMWDGVYRAHCTKCAATMEPPFFGSGRAQIVRMWNRRAKKQRTTEGKNR
jgi:hypothetical protein